MTNPTAEEVATNIWYDSDNDGTPHLGDFLKDAVRHIQPLIERAEKAERDRSKYKDNAAQLNACLSGATETSGLLSKERDELRAEVKRLKDDLEGARDGKRMRRIARRSALTEDES